MYLKHVYLINKTIIVPFKTRTNESKIDFDTYQQYSCCESNTIFIVLYNLINEISVNNAIRIIIMLVTRSVQHTIYTILLLFSVNVISAQSATQ